MRSRNIAKSLLIFARARFLAILILIAGLGAVAHGQSITGTLLGTVTDQQGAVVPSAVIKATSVDTGTVHTATSNAEGNYRIEYLAVGNYIVEGLQDISSGKRGSRR
jgi:hypothetical protein